MDLWGGMLLYSYTGSSNNSVCNLISLGKTYAQEKKKDMPCESSIQMQDESEGYNVNFIIGNVKPIILIGMNSPF